MAPNCLVIYFDILLPQDRPSIQEMDMQVAKGHTCILLGVEGFL